MMAFSRRTRAYIRRAVTAFMLASCASAVAQPKMSAPRTQYDGATPLIVAVIEDPEVARHLAAWGLSEAEVRAQVASLSVPDRAHLAYLLNRRWRTSHGQAAAALQARYLVTFSLLRQATARAGNVTSGAAQR